MSKFPRTLRIGPYRFTLRVDDAAVLAYQDAGGAGVGALTNLPDHTMIFASACDHPAAILHEILHALADQSGLNIRLGNEREEDVIQSLDHGLLGVLRDNPDLLRYLIEE